ncbi:hypothetical protein EWM64_g3021 [Hericium alpestre]|uniref:Uncharacterized protein n=1 Tax=Hericium alpestre TaxID=135208 RepID=A0A4Z0A3F1_9AGAM|nr:hypothetical protein EWM64_g3021 [Hericium alpestre]
MSVRSISRARLHDTAWIHIWTDRPGRGFLPRPGGPCPSFDAATGTFRPWDWAADPDWVDFSTPWRLFIPISPPPTLPSTSDMHWVYAENAHNATAQWEEGSGWRASTEVAGAYARTKMQMKGLVGTLTSICHVHIPHPAPMRSPTAFSLLRRDSPDALTAKVWNYRCSLLDWMGFFQWALFGLDLHWHLHPSVQAHPDLLDFAVRYLLHSGLRGVSIPTEGYASWPPLWRTTYQRWLLLDVPINYPWGADLAANRSCLDLRPSSYNPTWHHVHSSIPKQTSVLAKCLTDMRGLIAATNAEARRWNAAYHYREYANIEDFINIHVHYREAV